VGASLEATKANAISAMEGITLKTAPTESTVAELSQLLEAWFLDLGPCLIAYSGGVDSGLLAYVAGKTLGQNSLCVLADGSALSNRERTHAIDFAEKHDLKLQIVQTQEMEKEGYLANAGDRCYFCKQALFEKMEEVRAEMGKISKGNQPVVYGVNLDDLGDYRPGLQAAKEAQVKSPYLDLKIDKKSVRELCRHYQLNLAEKPAMPCLASRIPHGERVDQNKLNQIERGEDYLYSLGLRICRVRHHGDLARIEVAPEDFSFILENGKGIQDHFITLGFQFTSLDLGGFTSGKLNRTLGH
jgi:pyridinium-3,5-biscarboxylic acid mononucleotide sulfurtransferase